MSGRQLRGGGGGWGQGPPCSMSDPVPPGLRKPTLPSPSQRRETLWGCGSYHFPYSSCTTSSIHPDRNTQPCPLSSLPALSHKLGHVTSTPASISYPPLTPKTHSVPSRTVTKAPLCPHAVGGSAADAPTQAFPRGPQLPAPRPPPTRAVPQALPSCGCSAGLGPGPSPQACPQGSNDHPQSGFKPAWSAYTSRLKAKSHHCSRRDTSSWRPTRALIKAGSLTPGLPRPAWSPQTSLVSRAIPSTGLLTLLKLDPPITHTQL